MKKNTLMKIGLKIFAVVIALDLFTVYEASALVNYIQGCNPGYNNKKVTNILSRKVSECLLEEDDYAVNRFACLLRCSHTPFCRLACFQEGNRCRQYSAAVSSYAKPSFGADNPSTILEGICYFSWIFGDDLVPKIVDVKAKKGFDDREGDKVINGYYCNVDGMNHYTSGSEPGFLQFQLSSVFKISKLEIIGNSDYFGDVYVCVGNETGVGNNFGSHKEIGTTPKAKTNNEQITFTFPYPEYAKFISLRTKDGFLSIGDIKIL